jgi:arsenical pump membrane protein
LRHQDFSSLQETIAYGTIMMTVGLVLSLPRTHIGPRAGPAVAAAVGVTVLIATAVVSLIDLAAGFAILWRPFVTILSIMLTTSVAQQLGILDYFAKLLELGPSRSVGGVFRSVFIFSAVTSAILNNDAAVLLLTPLIIALVRRCYPDRPDLLVPFAFAIFSAAGVAPLVISNPMNLIVAEYAGIGFNEYAIRMIPIAIVGWLTAYAVLCAIFRHQLHSADVRKTGSIAVPQLSWPGKQFLAVMVVALGCYPALSYAGGPVWAVAAASATVGIWLCWQHRLAGPRRLAAATSWEILIFLFCIFIIVLGLRNVGLVGRIADLYSCVSSSAVQVILIGISSALGSAILNNHPMAILNALAIRNLPDGTQQLVLAALIGGDLGPRLLPMGSLAGLLWLDSLRRSARLHWHLSILSCRTACYHSDARIIADDTSSRQCSSLSIGDAQAILAEIRQSPVGEHRCDW